MKFKFNIWKKKAAIDYSVYSYSVSDLGSCYAKGFSHAQCAVHQQYRISASEMCKCSLRNNIYF